MTPPRAVYQGFRHTPLQTRTHPKVGKSPPKEDPPAIVQCPYCEERVLAVRKRYFDIDPIGEGLFNYTEHRHQPVRLDLKSAEFNLLRPDRGGATP